MFGLMILCSALLSGTNTFLKPCGGMTADRMTAGRSIGGFAIRLTNDSLPNASIRLESLLIFMSNAATATISSTTSTVTVMVVASIIQ
jgi:hypothetical protein